MLPVLPLQLRMTGQERGLKGLTNGEVSSQHTTPSHPSTHARGPPTEAGELMLHPLRDSGKPAGSTEQISCCIMVCTTRTAWTSSCFDTKLAGRGGGAGALLSPASSRACSSR